MEKKHLTYIDILRIIAIACVIYHHTQCFSFDLVTNGLTRIFFTITTIFTNIDVPIFFMISGSLLLSKDEDYIAVLKHRVLRFIMVIVLFESGYMLCNKIIANINNVPYEFTFSSVIRAVLFNSTSGLFSYWYLYTYLGFLLLLPFLRKAVRDISKQHIIVLIGLHFVINSLVPLINLYLLTHNIYPIFLSPDIKLPLVTEQFMFYPIIGYYIDHKIDFDKIKPKHIAAISVIGVLTIGLTIICNYYYNYKINFTPTHDFLTVFTYIITIIVYILTKYITSSIQLFNNATFVKVLSTIGGLTFGMYLFEPYLHLFYDKYNKFITNYLSPYPIVLLWIVIAMLIGGLLTLCLKKYH